jgi:hypothetical protein
MQVSTCGRYVADRWFSTLRDNSYRWFIIHKRCRQVFQHTYTVEEIMETGCRKDLDRCFIIFCIEKRYIYVEEIMQIGG